MDSGLGSLDMVHWLLLAVAVALALGFEFVNGFHDTANAVATVIYTGSLPPWAAVVWSGLWNFLGVLGSGGAVAFGIVSLLPMDLVVNVGSGAGFAMVFSMLVSAIIWNLGTWWLGLPASSSHALIGSILGVGLMNSWLRTGSLAGGMNWSRVEEVGLALLVSPVVGFLGTALLFLAVKAVVRQPALFAEPVAGERPPWWVRGVLWVTCTGVSYAHGSNDGQKGMGVVMLILAGMVPGLYALDLPAGTDSFQPLAAQAQAAGPTLGRLAAGVAPPQSAAATGALQTYLASPGVFSPQVAAALLEKNTELGALLAAHHTVADVPAGQRAAWRADFYLVAESLGKLSKTGRLSAGESASLLAYRAALERTTHFLPWWVKLTVALAMGLGTMVGWKRIVVTVGEKIGKAHLTCGQGAAAELVTMITIGLADRFGLPVSTTHVLSSGVAGAMVANRSGLQMRTLRHLVVAWVLTLPACVFLGALFFAAGLLLVTRSPGWPH